jgi:UDP:flavonoid glycosyltransferase YjiC (YdhE family)
MVDVERGQPPKWAFFCHAYNYGDTSRAIEVAKAMREAGGVVRFFHRGGDFVEHIAAAGLDPRALEPEITPEQNRRLMDLDQHRAPVGTPLPYSEENLVAMVESELCALREFAPDGVYCGLNLSSMISVPHAGLPAVTLVPTALCPAFFQRRMASFPDAMNRNLLVRHLVPERLKRALINRIMLGEVAKKSAVIFNRVRARYGLGPIHNYTSLVRGDLTLLPDTPELSGLPADALPPGYAFSGPLFARRDEPIPEEVERVLHRPGPKIYCAMGSSGAPEVLATVVRALRRDPGWSVVVATTNVVDPAALGEPSDNFAAARFLPAHKVNDLADLAVTHGGQGTVQTAMWAGTPVVGVAFQWEQQANLDAIARAGAGIRIPLYVVTEDAVLDGVRAMLRSGPRQAAGRLRSVVRATDGAREAVRRMNQLIGEKTRPAIS